MEHSFSKEDTYCLKNTAIILMIIHHMFSFYNRLEEGIIYQAYLKWNNIYIIHNKYFIFISKINKHRTILFML